MPKFNLIKKPIVLVILDGYGLAAKGPGNAIELAQPNFMEYLTNNYPHSRIKASGESVGLPEGQIGNSEVGHLTIGAGRTVYTGLSLINNEIENHNFDTNPILGSIEAINGRVHILGLASSGGVHSHINHIMALINYFSKQGKSIYLHLFLDGRDVSPGTAGEYVAKITNYANAEWSHIPHRKRSFNKG
jgi:2,3-bisphosphoglycerate-independent phosphoglycerate mutase